MLSTPHLLHGGTDLSWFLVSLAAAVIAYVIMNAARLFIPAWHTPVAMTPDSGTFTV